ncbi:MAG: HAD family phosphatase [Armatimonadota bacterium]|nr:HAD family phosphatase [Armatimonadota bacterium]MCX7777633.1 HAD family phosphatase [Armatimonadota bacterium]MDW8025879.1 HAD family phosphatase [Armatimonadota bacterium]
MLRAIIFDCDGVLADTERIHWQAFNEVLSKLGLHMSWDSYVERYLAYDDPTCFRAFLNDIGCQHDDSLIEEFVRQKRRLLSERSGSLVLTAYPGVVEFVTEASKHYYLAVASGAARDEILMVLNALGIAELFKVIVSSEDVTYGKPNPEPFIKAMERLNDVLNLNPPLKPNECVAVEDSIHGVRSAKAANMWCLAVTNTYPRELLSEADFVVDKLDVSLIEKLKEHIER